MFYYIFSLFFLRDTLNKFLTIISASKIFLSDQQINNNNNPSPTSSSDRPCISCALTILDMFVSFSKIETRVSKVLVLYSWWHIYIVPWL